MGEETPEGEKPGGEEAGCLVDPPGYCDVGTRGPRIGSRLGRCLPCEVEFARGFVMGRWHSELVSMSG